MDEFRRRLLGEEDQVRFAFPVDGVEDQDRLSMGKAVARECHRAREDPGSFDGEHHPF
jgi:hypothetical protein